MSRETVNYCEYAEGQPYHVGLGLAHMLLSSYDLQQEEDDE